MTIWVRRYDSFEEEREGDIEYWRQFTPNERVAIVEQMRAEWHEQNGSHDERLRRVVRVLDAPRG
jgi:hypothetical protein